MDMSWIKRFTPLEPCQGDSEPVQYSSVARGGAGGRCQVRGEVGQNLHRLGGIAVRDRAPDLEPGRERGWVSEPP
ncbi:hypothetical protein [Streptomyces sp. PTD9-10]|uniref:hypothetical protein n=1 Tax=Streptomyces sp. PTD9-10 TaxID=3120151 RepID=UPI003FCE582A